MGKKNDEAGHSGKLILNFVESLLYKFRGTEYKLDTSLKGADIFSEISRRLLWLLRGLFRSLLFNRKLNMIFIGPRVKITSWRLIRFGRGVTIHTGAIIDGLSKSGVYIGRNVSVGEYSIIRSTGSFRALGDGVVIGDNSGLGPYSYIGAAGGVRIGDNVIMGQHVCFHAENHKFTDLNIPIRDQGVTRQGIVVEDNCWIGANVTFIDGAYVESGCVIGAGTLVRGLVPKNSVAAGVPSRVISSRAMKQRT